MSIEDVDAYVNTALTEEEEILRGVIISARQVQTMLWGGANCSWGLEEWRRMFRKRIAKIDAIAEDNPHAHVELKKRLLQTAALAIALINIIDEAGCIPKRVADALESNLPEYADPLASSDLDNWGMPLDPTKPCPICEMSVESHGVVEFMDCQDALHAQRNKGTS